MKHLQNLRKYIAIDLKSFYASVECVERGLDPLTTNLVVADKSRTEKTICLAVSPSLKSYGISGRARLFEVVQKVREVNLSRQQKAPNRTFSGESSISTELDSNPSLKLSYIVASPQMAHYMQVSTKIYNIYLKYIAPEDIHVYSIDEVFMDVTDYLTVYQCTPHELAIRMIKDVLSTTGITATAGIGTNLYLCKVAMDIVAKHMPADNDGVRIAELDEYSYRKLLWSHRPLTDFWRIGRGYSRKLEAAGLYTMGDIARCSIGKWNDYFNEDFLYKMFGINAELLIDHAWGYEPVTIADIKAYKPENNSISCGQVLSCPYTFEKAKIIIREMAEMISLDLVDKGLVTNQIVLTIGYDTENINDNKIRNSYRGELTTDRYGRTIPKHAHGTGNIDRMTSSTRLITNCAIQLYEKIIDKKLLIRRIYIVANHVVPKNMSNIVNSSVIAIKQKTETNTKNVINDSSTIDTNPKNIINDDEDITKYTEYEYEQLDLFTDYEEFEKKRQLEEKELEREKQLQHAMLDIKKKFGKNAVLKGTSLEEGATAIQRNQQIGGHKA